MADLNQLFCGQFIAGPERFSHPNLTARTAFGTNLEVTVNAAVAVTRAARGEVELVCVGEILDPRAPSLQNSEIVAALLVTFTSFDALEEECCSLGGRWLLFARFGSVCRLYPDATGSRSASFVTHRGRLWIATQPGLLGEALGLSPDPGLTKQLFESPIADTLPIGICPYPGVTHLLPNHYLDLASHQQRRFWPSKPIAPTKFDEGVSTIASLLRGSLAATMYRGTVALPLTGGYDSRAMMAVSLDRKDELRYFTIIDATSPAHDVWLPFRIARRLSLGFEFVWARKAAPEMMDVIKRNTGRIWRDPNEHRIPAFAKPGAKYVVLGFASEILRCRDYKDGVHPVSVEPNLLASISGWRDDPVCIGATETWLATVPTGMNVATLDLYFWECRLGGWTALGCTALDTVVESISLFNCRQLFEVGLGLDVEYRSQPYKIYRELCRRHAPAVADMSFNTTPLDDIAELARRILPPAVRKHVKARVLAVRKRVAGASDLRA